MKIVHVKTNITNDLWWDWLKSQRDVRWAVSEDGSYIILSAPISKLPEMYEKSRGAGRAIISRLLYHAYNNARREFEPTYVHGFTPGTCRVFATDSSFLGVQDARRSS